MAYTGKKPVDFVDVTQSQSMTVSDDLTVDTNTLVVDSTNNRVGVGTTDTTSEAQAGKLKVRNDVDYSSTEFEDNATLVLQNETDNHSAVIVFHSDNGSNSSKRAGIVGGNINSNTYALGFYGDISNKTSATAPDVIIDSSGNVGIGTSGAPSLTFGGGLEVQKAGISSVRVDNSSDSVAAEFSAYDATFGALLYTTTAHPISFGTSGGLRARIDTSGALMVNTTSTGTAASPNVSGTGYFSTYGASSAASFSAVSQGAVVGYLNRNTSDGTILDIRKDDNTVGTIGSSADRPYFASSSCGIRITDSQVLPTNSSGSNSDDVMDIGAVSARFDDVYATNGTIQTSDRNEKENIASMSDAEITAAKAISKLFKTFKWKDAVAKKGDSARTHAGVIAQDVQQAMTDAGLDAGNYAFFISSTWWETQTEVPAVAEETDEEGNVIVEAQEAYTRTDTYETAEEAPAGATERTRLGIRYPELLAFIGAATEQRLTNIETRLAALENA